MDERRVLACGVFRNDRFPLGDLSFVFSTRLAFRPVGVTTPAARTLVFRVGIY